jgi:23S rRNA pseudouridine1911/1915/1917 synthase
MAAEPRAIELSPAESETGLRLDVFLATRLTELSRSAAHRAIAVGDVLIDGARAKPRHLVKPGQIVTVILRPAAPCDLTPQAIDLQVVYEDSDLIVVDKPAGLVTHPARGHTQLTLVHALLAHCGDLSGVGGELRPGIVHRLDKDTTGLIVAAKNDLAHRGLAAQLADRTMSRTYLALVYGQPEWDTLEVDAPIGRHPKERTAMAVTDSGRAARTRLTVEQRLGPASLLRAELQTGRTHQVRVHCAHVGHPLLGDRTYGLRQARRAVLSDPQRTALLALGGQALHAVKLRFRHPADGRPMSFDATPPAAFRRLLAALAAEPGGPADAALRPADRPPDPPAGDAGP